MAHVETLDAFFKIELVASTFLIIVLLVLGVTKKERILSETGLSRFKLNWRKFRAAFYLGFIAMFLFLILLGIELIELGTNMPFHSLYPLETEWIKISMVAVLFLVNLINLYIVLVLTGGRE